MAALRIKKLVDDIDTPAYSRDGDCGIDLRASGHFTTDPGNESRDIAEDEITIRPHERLLIKCGIILEIPPGHFGSIRDRSGLAAKQGLHVLAGVIDENYRGEIGVVLINSGSRPHTIKKNDRIAQIIIQPYLRCEIRIAENTSATERGEKGYGSSGR